MESLELLWRHPASQLVVVILLALIAIKFVDKSVHKFFLRTEFFEERKEKTIESMIRSFTRYTAIIGIGLYATSLFVDDFGKVLAGAGVVGIIIGFGAQSLIRDILAGIFLIYEKQLHKGDFVTVNNTFNGTVEDIGLRFLKVREWSGKLLTISNGEIKQIQNFNIDRMRVIERVVVSYRENPATVFSVLEKVCERLNEDISFCLKKDVENCIVEPFQVYGMTSLNANFKGYEYTITGLVEDRYYWDASKSTRRAIAEEMYAQEIQMAEERTFFSNTETPII
ncbi:mechanosensitive ion channel family protein [Bacillus salitolerans]|uniref:Mechanosensitive ion channel family protein n=1 Tax=Bacillus salitolerans TaxID=1437434 RepID=A0ABW4LTN8_9BACI